MRLSRSGSVIDITWILVHQGCFPFNKNSCLKFWKFQMPNGTAQSGCTGLTQATAHLVIVLISRIQKSGTGDNNFVKWKEKIRPTDRKDQTGQSGPPSKLVPNIVVGPNRNSPLHVMYQLKFPEFLGWMDSAPNEQMNPFPIADLLVPLMYYDLSVSDLWLLILIQINLMKQTLRRTHKASPRGVFLRENQLHFTAAHLEEVLPITFTITGKVNEGE